MKREVGLEFTTILMASIHQLPIGLLEDVFKLSDDEISSLSGACAKEIITQIGFIIDESCLDHIDKIAEALTRLKRLDDHEIAVFYDFARLRSIDLLIKEGRRVRRRFGNVIQHAQTGHTECHTACTNRHPTRLCLCLRVYLPLHLRLRQCPWGSVAQGGGL